ncbi:BCCT family transporter [Brevibacterium daeguense]|uniref:BCCT family transporter n=1 Tax=Brevibacterium daeguense TaxID=909936 RepID=A0ABP8EHH9_9MICO|nr:BCCT family transporter [Brevibacterium daeguense]
MSSPEDETTQGSAANHDQAVVGQQVAAPSPGEHSPGEQQAPAPSPGDRQESLAQDALGDPPEKPAEERVPEHAQIAENDTDEEIVAKLRRQGVHLGRGMVFPNVFWPSIIVVVAITVLTMVFPDTSGAVLTSIQTWITVNLGWYYMLIIAGFIVFTLIVCFSRFGKIKLGNDDDEPEFSTLSWFSMLFAAGMGIGLVFYGVGEPLTYATSDPKPGWTGNQAEIAKLSMAQTFIHWGLHPWAVYAVIGLSVAYAIHRRGRPVSIRWALEPLFGERVKGRLGDLIDILAVFGTIFGIATSLGLGVQQISAGLVAMGVVDAVSSTLLIVLIVVITLLATMSVVSGLGKGIKWLSNINLSLAALLLISVLLLGPTLFLLQNFVESLGSYLDNVLNLTFDVGAYTGEEGAAWGATWTIFYWGWWISWAPFVGVFIARISRGRTVREFIGGVLLVPTLLGFFWFSVMGGAGLYRQLFGAGDLVDPEVGVVAEEALFDVLNGLPLGAILSVLAIVVIAIFFITSSDSGSLVVDMLASGGHPNPPIWSRVLFALLEGALAIGLLLAGGLGALQAAAIATALPFSLVLLAMCVATLRSLSYDQAKRDRKALRERYKLFRGLLTEDFDEALGRQVDSRIDYRIDRTRGIFDRPQPGEARRWFQRSRRE